MTAATGEAVQVCELLARDIKALGIEYVFGLMSDDTAVFATALDSSGVRFYGARHENNAIAMAEGHASATGELTVALIGRGPATANGLHAATYASRTGAPLLIIYGDQPVPGGAVNTMGPDYKGFDGAGVLRAAGIRTFVATSGDGARSTLADALAAARQGGAVALLLPTNVQLAEIADDGTVPTMPPAPAAVPAPRAQSIAAVAAVLAESKRPLIVAGLGAHKAGAGPALEQLAERTGALLITSARGKDMFRGNPNNLGIIGSFSHSMARRMADQADCVLVFGAGLNFLTMSFGAAVPDVPLVQVDAVRANIGRWHPADVAVVGDARLAAEALLDAVPERSAADKPFHAEEVRAQLSGFDPAQDFQAANTARTVDPRALAIELDKLLPEDRTLVYDAGNFMSVVPFLTVPGPGHLKLTSDFASIGLGFGTALGYAKARPDSTTVLVIGDGGFMMTMGELETVVREDLPMVIVLMNDCAYGAELHFLKARNLPVEKSVFPDVDFAPIAEGFAFEGHTVRSLDQLRQLAPVLAKPEGPILLDCKINADVAAPFIHEFAEFESRGH